MLVKSVDIHDTGQDTYWVTVIYTTVNNVGADTSASAVIVDVLGVTLASVRNTRQAPGGAALLSDASTRHHLIGLDVVNLHQEISAFKYIQFESTKNRASNYIRMISQSLEASFVKVRRKTLEQVVVNMVGITREQVHDVVEKRRAGVALHFYNILAMNNGTVIARNKKRSGFSSFGGRGSSHDGQQGEESGQTHCEADYVVVWVKMTEKHRDLNIKLIQRRDFTVYLFFSRYQ